MLRNNQKNRNISIAYLKIKNNFKQRNTNLWDNTYKIRNILIGI